MNEQDPIVAQLAAEALGASAPSPADAATPQTKDEPTVAEQATELASPNAEGEVSEMDSVIYDIDFGDGKRRQLNPKQIASTFDRYGKLNQRWQQVAPLSPVLEFAQGIIESARANGHELTAEDLTAFLQESISKASSFGSESAQPQANNPAEPQELSDDAFAKWEEENAVSLPPGFREALTKTQTLEQQLAQTNQLLMQVLQASQGAAQTAQAQASQAQEAQVSAVKQTIMNNLNQVQQALQLPDSAEQDFFNFAASRGYTIEDFIDPQLTMAIAQDFRNNMNSPEMERLRAIAQRRQAYTGSMQGSPGGAPGGAAAPTNEDAAYLNSLVDANMPR